ncbi:MAG: signal peptidase II [Ignavibacteriaceae bacterium]|nr:signal peptidase II [Ignavibacteriaceae bacterium]
MKVLYLSFFVVASDQITKLLVKGFSIPFLNFNYDGMYYGQIIPIIGDFARLTYIENPGMAFGYDPGNAFKLWITLFSLIASIGLIFYIYIIRNKSLSLRAAIALILGGAVGNLIDRMFYGVIFDYAPLFYGKVVDFVDVDFFNFTLFGKSYERWPIFNVADAAVTVGVLILILFYRKHQQEEKEITNVLDASEMIPVSENLPSNPGNLEMEEEKVIKSDGIADGEAGKREKIQD